eukprot:gnl/MRDRNA2_/MRDRNA2_99598_c0_seq1.p1 gnl/MRDRNA2_/MRDRNA2_99598_c0~~gnl/MRDRNA2_/MRDRNA2_99598_c0_seq1.p1  ORF type:complete len:178 (+),score=15.71 gnl/MRDRNA2_/MRDRNA2_99598_c0_seq1:71-604(+)
MYRNKYGQTIRSPSAYAATGAPIFSSGGTQIRNFESYSSAVNSYKSQASSNPTHLYHYTTSENAAKILESGTIKASTNTKTDCRLGPGTYFTSKAPNCSKENILSNNYGPARNARSGNSRSNPYDSRADSFVKIPTENLWGQGLVNGKDETGRNVWKVNGDVNLKNVGAKVGRKYWW